MTQRQLIESTANDIIAAIREHGPTRDVIVPRLEKLIAVHGEPQGLIHPTDGFRHPADCRCRYCKSVRR